jgi:hypothetical protein
MSEPLPATDFSAFFLQPSAVVNIELPTGGPLLFEGRPVRVHVHGPSSAEFTAASDAQQRFIASQVQLKKGMVKSGIDPEEARQQDVRFLTAITISVENFPYPGGTAAIYLERGLAYIPEQVRAYLNDQSNFFPGKPKT